MGLLGLISGIVEAKTAIETVAPHFFGGGYETSPSPTGYPVAGAGGGGTIYTGELATLATPGYAAAAEAGSSLATITGSSVPRSLAHWLWRILQIYGPSVAQAVWHDFQARRRQGQSTALAKAAEEEAYPTRGIRVMRKLRRRMNPTNIRALRRAVRRLKSFGRATRKVRGVLPHRGRPGPRYYRRRPRRGDLYPVELYADEYDEAEDLGYDPEDFFDRGED